MGVLTLVSLRFPGNLGVSCAVVVGLESLVLSFGGFSAFLGSGLLALGAGGGGGGGAPWLVLTGSSGEGLSTGSLLFGGASSLGFCDAGSSFGAGEVPELKESFRTHISCLGASSSTFARFYSEQILSDSDRVFFFGKKLDNGTRLRRVHLDIDLWVYEPVITRVG